ncbi:LysR family transcriptional regulator [Steroidobacter flavus]|uniref:LysR family transcriptional regulator n=1 Tax=Steroidobacter flavus TaxID=1842136 RepID=A0ABV8SWN2_9GAMM
MDFDPTLLRAFVAVHDAGGFTRAAQRLHLTQSAVSHQIRRLEEQIGRPLFYRTTRKLTLTEDGSEFLRHAQQILTSLDALTRRFQSSMTAGVVRFGTPETFMGERLAPLLARFSHAFPSVRLDVNVGTYFDLRSMIDAGELDLAVALSLPHEEHRNTVLRKSQFVWVGSETFASRGAASLPLAFAPAPCVHRQIGIAALADTPVDWHVAFTSPSNEGISAAVLAGLAITVQTRCSLKPGMKIVDGQFGLPALPQAEFTLIWRAGEIAPAAKEFGRLLLP